MFAIRARHVCSGNTIFCLRNIFTDRSVRKSLQFNELKLRGQFTLRPSIVKDISQFRWCSSSVNGDTGDVHRRIYYGSLTPRIKAVKVFSLTTSLAGLGAQPIFMEQGMKLGGTGLAIFFCSFVGFFTFVTPLLLHFITKKYVTEIHYNSNKDEYVATTISLLMYKIETKFRTSDVKVPEVPGMFTSFFVRDKPLFVDPALFDDPEHYVRIMGYDKPIDFKLGSPEDDDSLKKPKSQT